MQKSENIVRYTAAELDEKLARGEDVTDWAYVDSLTEEELEASIDWEDEGEFDSSKISTTLSPQPQRPSTVQLEGDIVAWFRSHDANFRIRMSVVLDAYVNAQQAKLRPIRRQRRAS